MKIRPLLITICSFFLLQTAFSQDLRQDLLLYYPLDGNAKDYSGRNYDGDDHAIPTTDRTNTPNMAMEFNGSDTYIDLPFNFDLKPTFPFAIAFWVYFEEGATFIMTTDYAQDNHTGAWFNRILASKKFSFSVGDATGNTSPNQRFTFDTDYVMEDKTWYHVAVNWLDLHDAQVYINAFERETFTSGGAVGLGYTNNPGTIGKKR
ncbi:MAG: LamG-like jellyroll fold domain-containing protein [Saprospiraceae bacterium]